ncbi:hypothetical protein ACT3TH_07540 [Psychrobacter sp. AOP22-C1-C5]|uniref:hypothetical protein n=1 Tax=Psychrobacter sp. AOP22-C1-C5 TaxID=3457716 RepID=UPI004035B241
MKKQYSTVATPSDVDQSKKSFLKSNNTYVALFGLIFLFLLFVSACSPETPSDDGSLSANDSTNLDRKLQNAEDVEENIRNSYARLAAKRTDICPKLIQEEVGSHVIERTDEVMVDDYCDYFLYPRNGQNISVMLSDSRIEALLVVPMLHDFANGDYQVESYDKHVIRLAYNGATYKPKNLMYDVAVTVYN